MIEPLYIVGRLSLSPNIAGPISTFVPGSAALLYVPKSRFEAFLAEQVAAWTEQYPSVLDFITAEDDCGEVFDLEVDAEGRTPVGLVFENHVDAVEFKLSHPDLFEVAV